MIIIHIIFNRVPSVCNLLLVVDILQVEPSGFENEMFELLHWNLWDDLGIAK